MGMHGVVAAMAYVTGGSLIRIVVMSYFVSKTES